MKRCRRFSVQWFTGSEVEGRGTHRFMARFPDGARRGGLPMNRDRADPRKRHSCTRPLSAGPLCHQWDPLCVVVQAPRTSQEDRKLMDSGTVPVPCFLFAVASNSRGTLFSVCLPCFAPTN